MELERLLLIDMNNFEIQFIYNAAQFRGRNGEFKRQTTKFNNLAMAVFYFRLYCTWSSSTVAGSMTGRQYIAVYFVLYNTGIMQLTKIAWKASVVCHGSAITHMSIMRVGSKSRNKESRFHG
jgi:hypothetical protein